MLGYNYWLKIIINLLANKNMLIFAGYFSYLQANKNVKKN